MTLAPMIVIGCGGSGGKVVLGLRDRLEKELQRRGWRHGIPEAFQLKWVDVPVPQETFPDFGRSVADEDYAGLAWSDIYREIDDLVIKGAGNRIERLIGWRPSPYIDLPFLEGAGQMRALGRMGALSNASKVTNLIQKAVQDAKTSIPEFESFASHLGVQNVSGAQNVSKEPFVFVVSSLAGGTGAGVFLDVCDLVRASNPNLGQRIISVLLTAEIFPGIAGVGIPTNSLGASSELMNAMLAVQRPLETLYGQGAAVNVLQGSGPSVAYLVGLRTLDAGGALESPDDAYRVVTESLMALMLDEHLQQDMIGHDLTNRNLQQADRGSKFKMLVEPPSLNQNAMCGFVSSFGSAKVAVGSSRFGDWARDRMVRSVLEYLLKGWRDRGLELIDPDRRDVVQDPEIVEHIVNRDREEFFDECGLWEEDEPDATRHDQVVDGILNRDQLNDVLREFHKKRIAEMGSFSQLGGREWVNRIPAVIKNRQSELRLEVAGLLEKGSDDFAVKVVKQLETAVSKWLAEYGLPVAAGLVKELSQQCSSAAEQLQREARGMESASRRDPAQAISAAFHALGGSRVNAKSDFVQDAVRKSIGPNQYWMESERCEKAASLLTDVVEKVLVPLMSALESRGEELDMFAGSSEVQDWPVGAGVSAKYAPAPSEFCLVGAEEWNGVYEQLLKESTAKKNSAGSVGAARDTICAGGFKYGDAAAPREAPTALRLDSGSGWLGKGRPVGVELALSPEEIKDRVDQFFLNPSNSMGRFLESGLEEHLAKQGREVPGGNHTKRLERFRKCLGSAMQMASPMCRIQDEMVSRLHNDGGLATSLTVQELPFDGGHPAHDVAKAILTGQDGVSAGAFKSRSKTGMESVLVVRRLATPVHPAVVASLYEPIVKDWDKAVTPDDPATAIKTFWNNKRARLLNEFIPLPKPAIESIVRGWFVGRLLGLITDPTPSTGPHVHTRDDFGNEEIAAFPWPLLRHGRNDELEEPESIDEWLPAILEHLPLAMMMLSQDPHALDAYEQTFRLGHGTKKAKADVKRFITKGETASSNPAQITGDTEQDRRNNFDAAIKEIREAYIDLDDATKELRSGDYSDFCDIAFGRELFGIVHQELDAIHEMVAPTRGGRTVG